MYHVVLKRFVKVSNLSTDMCYRVQQLFWILFLHCIYMATVLVLIILSETNEEHEDRNNTICSLEITRIFFTSMNVEDIIYITISLIDGFISNVKVNKLKSDFVILCIVKQIGPHEGRKVRFSGTRY